MDIDEMREAILAMQKQIDSLSRGSTPDRMLTRSEIEAEYGITRRWLELAVIHGEGPPYVKLSGRQVRYSKSAFDKWLADRTRTKSKDE
jgi:predicted DNA-binding transcriptional regulator AlpA